MHEQSLLAQERPMRRFLLQKCLGMVYAGTVLLMTSGSAPPVSECDFFDLIRRAFPVAFCCGTAQRVAIDEKGKHFETSLSMLRQCCRWNTRLWFSDNWCFPSWPFYSSLPIFLMLMIGVFAVDDWWYCWRWIVTELAESASSLQCCIHQKVFSGLLGAVTTVLPLALCLLLFLVHFVFEEGVLLIYADDCD